MSIAVQWEDSGPWTHGTVNGHESEDQNGRSCKIKVTKTGHTFPKTMRDVKATLIFAGDYP